MRKTGLFAAAFAVAACLAGVAAAAPNGTFTINNNSSDVVSRAANSFNGSSSFPASIAVSSSDFGSAATSGTMSGTVIYVNPVTGLGCSFTTLVYASGSGYAFSLSAAPYGAGSTATCRYTTSYRNTSTGAFSATWTMSGF